MKIWCPNPEWEWGCGNQKELTDLTLWGPTLIEWSLNKKKVYDSGT